LFEILYIFMHFFYYLKGNNILLKYELRNNNLEDNNQLMITNNNFNGVGLVPKRALDVMKCEVGRLLQVTKDTISPSIYLF